MILAVHRCGLPGTVLRRHFASRARPVRQHLKEIKALNEALENTHGSTKAQLKEMTALLERIKRARYFNAREGKIFDPRRAGEEKRQLQELSEQLEVLESSAKAKLQVMVTSLAKFGSSGTDTGPNKEERTIDGTDTGSKHEERAIDDCPKKEERAIDGDVAEQSSQKLAQGPMAYYREHWQQRRNLLDRLQRAAEKEKSKKGELKLRPEAQAEEKQSQGQAEEKQSQAKKEEPISGLRLGLRLRAEERVKEAAPSHLLEEQQRSWEKEKADMRQRFDQKTAQGADDDARSCTSDGTTVSAARRELALWGVSGCFGVSAVLLMQSNMQKTEELTQAHDAIHSRDEQLRIKQEEYDDLLKQYNEQKQSGVVSPKVDLVQATTVLVSNDGNEWMPWMLWRRWSAFWGVCAIVLLAMEAR